MNTEQINLAAELLRTARIENKVIHCIPAAIRPTNLQEAYAVQDRFVEILGRDVGGWFCACTNPAIQRILNLDEPYCARLFKDHIFPEPVTEKRFFAPLCDFILGIVQS